MNTDSLMLGNYLLFDDVKDGQRVFPWVEVTTLKNFIISGFEFPKGPPVQEQHQDLFKGIPIEEKLLYILGFEKTKFRHYDNSISKNVFKKESVYLQPAETGWIIMRKTPGYQSLSFINTVYFIHDLQNYYWSIMHEKLIAKIESPS